MKIHFALLVLMLVGVIIACEETPKIIENPYEDISASVEQIPFIQQRPGDAVKGKEYLLTGNYIDSGIPREIYDQYVGTGSNPNELERTGINEDLPYDFNGIFHENGVELVVANCMQCHSGYVNNEFVQGLGNVMTDYTTDQSGLATLLDNFVISAYGENSDEYEAYFPFSRAAKATGPYLLTETVGSNPANKLALVLAAHRQPEDLVWTDELLFDIPEETPPSDVPAWWHMKKKNAMFVTGLGSGDFAKHMMTASILTLEDSTKANEIDSKFPDVLAYLKTLEAPAYPSTIDMEKAARGNLLFEDNCSKCHGTYGENETYPNLFVKQSLIDTDPEIAKATKNFSDFVGWFNNSWFSNGENPSEYLKVDGYMAPPLDGIWATAPYLHNGSVPTLFHLLDSESRPEIWKRTSSSSNYNFNQVGLKFEEETTKSNKFSFDTNLVGYSNSGHYFSDYLTNEQREDLLEYLKTL